MDSKFMDIDPKLSLTFWRTGEVWSDDLRTSKCLEDLVDACEADLPEYKVIGERNKSRIVEFIEEQIRKHPSVHRCDIHSTNIKVRGVSNDNYSRKLSETVMARCLGIYGKIHEIGLFGIDRNCAVAVKMYRLGIMYNNPASVYGLGRCFELGIGVEKDGNQSCYFYRLSYKLGYVKGLHRYGKILLQGNDYVERDIQTGYHLMRLAVGKADRIYPDPYYDFGLLHFSEHPLLIQDPKYGLELLMRGAELGCKFCQYSIGQKYETGGSLKKNIDLAVLWYQKSANRGLIEAEDRLREILGQSRQF
jgi:TPR repeat protein